MSIVGLGASGQESRIKKLYCKNALSAIALMVHQPLENVFILLHLSLRCSNGGGKGKPHHQIWQEVHRLRQWDRRLETCSPRSGRREQLTVYVNSVQAGAMMYKMGKSHEGKRWQNSITTRTSNPKILELRQDCTIVLSKALSMAEVHMQSSCKCVERLNSSNGATTLKSSARTLMRQRLRAESDGAAMCTSSSWKFFIRVGLDWVLLSRYGLRRD